MLQSRIHDCKKNRMKKDEKRGRERERERERVIELIANELERKRRKE